MMTSDAAGINMDAIPSIRLEEGWNSNVYNSSVNEVSSFGTRVTPGLALRFTTPDNVIFQISGNYERVWYYNPEAKAAESDTYYFRLDSTGMLRFTPNLSMIPSVYYIDTTNSYRRVQLLPSADPLLPPVSITNYGSTESVDFGGGVRFDYLATPKISIGFSGNYGEQRFDNSTPGSGLTNSTSVGAGASISYLFTPRTSAGLGILGSHQTYDNTTDTDILSAGILFDHQFSPPWHINGAFGISRIRQGSAPGIPAQNATAPTGRFNVSYTSGTLFANAFGSAGYSGASGFGQGTRQWTVGMSIRDQFAREWSWDLQGTYQDSKSAFAPNAVSLQTIYGSAGLRYQPLVWFSLDLTGSLNHQSSNGQFGSALDAYAGILGFTIGQPYNIF
jgi:hypothetical protein